MSKTLFEKKIETYNKELIATNSKEPKFAITFSGETSRALEIEAQAKFLMALMDINTLRIF